MSCPDQRSSRTTSRGLTLLELMVALGVLSLISVLIYGAFSTISKGKQVSTSISERYRMARVVMTRMSREISMAFLSQHVSTPALNARITAFVGSSRRIDFAAFAHRRVLKDAHESDQCELGYFTGTNLKKRTQTDLLRREQTILDLDPGKGGVVQILLDDVDTFSVRYLDPLSGLWTDSWDSTSAAGQLGRIPLMVELYLTMRSSGGGGDMIRLRTKTQPMISQPLAFALK